MEGRVMRRMVIFVGIRRPMLELSQTLLSTQQLGLGILLIVEKTPDIVFPFVDVLVCNFTDEDRIFEQALAWQRHYNLIGIVNWHDVTSPLRARLAQRLELPAPSVR